MHYIECAHCGKQYEVTDKIRASEGQFVNCVSCKRDFLIVITNDEEAEEHHQKEMEKSINTTGWDPSLTMPVEDEPVKSSDKVKEKALKDDAAEAEALLAALQAQKKRKIQLAALLGTLIVVMGLYLFMQEEPVTQQAQVNVKAEKKVVLSPKAQDETNPVCRQAAAKQWMIDTHAMHGDYDAEEFVRILKQSDKQKDIVQSQCVQENLIKEIIAAATAKEVPSWLELEISALQANRK